MRLSAFHRTMKEHESVNRRQARSSSPKSISPTRTGFELLYQNDSRVDPNHPRRLDWALLASVRLRSPRTDPTRPTHPVTADHRPPFIHLRCSMKKTTSTRFFPKYDSDLSPLSVPPTGLLCDLLVQDTILIRLCKRARGECVPLPDLDKRVLNELLLT